MLRTSIPRRLKLAGQTTARARAANVPSGVGTATTPNAVAKRGMIAILNCIVKSSLVDWVDGGAGICCGIMVNELKSRSDGRLKGTYIR